MTLVTFQDGKVVVRDGRVGTGQGCCCRETVCECNWPRQITLTIANIDPGYGFFATGGGYPASGKYFEPACDEPTGFIWEQGRSGIGPSWRAGSFFNPDGPILLEFDGANGTCDVPVWTGTLLGGLSTAGVFANDPIECNEVYSGARVVLQKLNPAISVLFSSSHGSGASASVTEVNESTGAITEITLASGGSGYAFLETERVEPTVEVSITSVTGSGAELSVTLEQTVDFNGDSEWRVKSVAVDNPGSGYLPSDSLVFTSPDNSAPPFLGASATFVLDRQQPTLGIDASSADGTGAEFSVAVAAATDFDGNDVWQVDSVTVTDGGSGYSDGESVAIDLGASNVEQSPASLVIRNGRAEPELTLTGTADLTISVESLGGTPEAWEVTSVDVIDGGSGYSDGQYLNVTLGPDDMQEPFAAAFLRVKCVRDEPTVSVLSFFASGEGAVFNVTVVQSGDVWIVDEVEIANGGTGYSETDFLFLQASIGQTVTTGTMSVTVDENGTITSASITNAGEFFLDTGVIEEVEVLGGGRYYKDTGVIESVTVLSGGQYYETDGGVESVTVVLGGNYYKEQPTGNIIVDTPAVTILSNIGVGATATATVDDDPGSPTFGQVTAITITNGGAGYRLTGVYRKIVVEFAVGILAGTLAAAYTEPSTILCYGEALASYIPAPGTLESQTSCGNELLDASYPVILSGFGAPFGFASVPDGAVYSSRDAFGICGDLRILDTGSGQITCTIAPA